MSKRILAALMALALTVTLFSGCKTTTTEIPGEDDVIVETSSAKASSTTSSKTSSSKPATSSKKQTTTTTTTTTASTSSKNNTNIDVPNLIKRTTLPEGWKSNYLIVEVSSDEQNSSSGTEELPDPFETVSIYDGFKEYSLYGSDIFNILSSKAWRPNNQGLYDDLNDTVNSGAITLWGYGAYLEGVGAAAAFDTTNTAYVTEYKKVLTDVMRYQAADGIVNGNRGVASGTYLGLTCAYGSNNAEVFYDDDVWVLKEFMQAYHTLGDSTYRTYAEKMLKYILETSWNETWSAGGLEWMDRLFRSSGSESYQKNVCINAPTADATLEMYELSGSENQYYVAEAKKIYDWTLKNLTKPSTDGTGTVVYDKIVFNAATPLEPTLDKGELPYNYGMMIASGARLYSALKDTNPTEAQGYLNDALGIALKAYNKYCKWNRYIDGYVGFPWTNTNPWFSTYLVEGFLTLQSKYSDAKTSDFYLRAVKNGYAFACKHRPYSTDGWFFTNVSHPTGSIPSKDISIMNQGASMRSLFMLAKNVEKVDSESK